MEAGSGRDEQPDPEDPEIEEIDLEGLDVTHDFARGKASTVIRAILASPTPQAASTSVHPPLAATRNSEPDSFRNPANPPPPTHE